MSPNESREFLNYLPASLRADEAFLRPFLLPFERLLNGPADSGGPPGIEQILDRIHTYFWPGSGHPDADRAPSEFLPWLAGWVAISLREDWPDETKRRFIEQAARNYARRGTKKCMESMLELFLGTDKGLSIEDSGDDPYFFSVRLRVDAVDDVGRLERIARAIIDREKPAHTYYRLIIESPALRIVDLPNKGGILVGINTLIGFASTGDPG